MKQIGLFIILTLSLTYSQFDPNYNVHFEKVIMAEPLAAAI